MRGRGVFYLFSGAIVIVLILLGVIIFRKPAKPPVMPVAPPTVVEVPVEALVEAPAPSAEMPPEVSAPSIEAKAVEVPAAVIEPAPAEAPAVETPQVQMPAAEEKKTEGLEFQKGMVYVAWTDSGYSNSNSPKAMEQLIPLGVEWAGVVATWYQDKYNTSQIYPLKDKTPTDESLTFAIRKLHELKLKVMLKPHLDLIDAGGKWRGEIEFSNPAEWESWFETYASFLLHYAAIAAQENVELLCIGTELTRSTLGQPQSWRELIKKIREIYKGKLTYAANWHEEFSQITFWDALDYAGIDPYFPLVSTARPKVEELKSAWEDWLKVIEDWQQKINKPVVFTEIGYKSSIGATDEPWQHVAMGELDLEIQVNCYKALLEIFWDKPWFYGAYWWYWGANPKMGGALNTGFTPQNKPAQEIVKEWYSKSPSGKIY